MVYLFVFYCLIFCPFHIRSLDRGDDTPIYTRDLDRDPVESRLRGKISDCLLYTSPSPRDLSTYRMPSSA